MTMMPAAPDRQGLQPATQTPLPFSVIIPAHNEAAVIARCLAAITDGAADHASLDIIVVANGCTDDTAEAAKKAAPAARIVVLDKAAKATAINEGLRIAKHLPCLVVDADVVCNYRSLAATASALVKPGIMAASPAVHIPLEETSAWVRGYYRVWQQLPYVTDSLVGGGVYGLSKAGLAHLGKLPAVVADDLYVRTRFSPAERCSVTRDDQGKPIFTTILPPRNAINLLRIEARRLRGKRQVDARFPTAHSGTINGAPALLTALRNGASLPDVAIYVLTKILARAIGATNTLTGREGWSRDLSTRAG